MADSDNENKRPIRLFYSYAHEDEALRLCLEKHLAHMRWNGLITEWHDRRICAGDDWENAIDQNIETAEIILLLLSVDFIASPYCWSKEMTKALERHARKEVRVIPVILRPCRWTSTWLKVLQAVPKDAKPVMLWANQDEAFDDVAMRIEGVVEALQQTLLTAPAPSPGAKASPSPASERRHEIPLASLDVGAGAPGEGSAAPSLSRERDSAGVRAANAPQPMPKNGIIIGGDWHDLPDFAVFKQIDAPWCPEMVMLPAGTFLMGSPLGEEDRFDDEGPQHRVTISRRFALGRYAVTFDEYDHFCEVTKRQKPGDKGWGRGRRPVINVSWLDAQAYLAWLSGEAGQLYQLPTEAEWEYACRAGTTTPFSFGDRITPKQVNYDSNDAYGYAKEGLYRGQTVPVGSLPANPWGLHEMHGNVFEWCHDGEREYADQATIDPLGSAEGDAFRAARGGSWDYAIKWVRSACRLPIPPSHADANHGFRLSLRSGE